MKNLRIAFLLNRGPMTWQSQEDSFFRLCRALVARGAVPVVVYAGKASEEVLLRMRESGAKVIAGAGIYGRRHFSQVLKATFKKWNINFVHIRYFRYNSIVPWLVRSLSVRKIIYTEANSWLPAERNRWSWKRAATRLRAKAVCRPISRFIAISGFIRDRLILFGIKPDRIDIVYNGVDVDRFTPNSEARAAWRQSHGVGEGEVVISTVSRLDADKEIDTIVHAFDELVKRGVSARLYIAGSGPLERDLKTLSRKLGLTERIHWLGHLEDPLPLFQASDIFTLASLGEAFGFVLTEAMACAVPCVGTRSGGIVEVIEEGRTGLLSAPHDPGSFADAYECLAGDANLRRTMGQAGVERVRDLFSAEMAVQKTLSVYEEVLGTQTAQY